MIWQTEHVKDSRGRSFGQLVRGHEMQLAPTMFARVARTEKQTLV